MKTMNQKITLKAFLKTGRKFSLKKRTKVNFLYLTMRENNGNNFNYNISFFDCNNFLNAIHS